jgi:hypothetical protein
VTVEFHLGRRHGRDLAEVVHRLDDELGMAGGDDAGRRHGATERAGDDQVERQSGEDLPRRLGLTAAVGRQIEPLRTLLPEVQRLPVAHQIQTPHRADVSRLAGWFNAGKWALCPPRRGA